MFNLVFNKVFNFHQQLVRSLNHLSGLGPLVLRLYLAPVFIVAGMNKVNAFEDTVAWFGNSEWGLGLPFPELMTALAAGTEVLGGILLIVGFATRYISIPLMVTMLVAIFAVHWDSGWQAIHDPMSWGANANTEGAIERLSRAKAILQEYGNYDWLTEKGSLVMLNNGIEFGVTYFVMLLTLLLTGGGRFFSADYYVKKWADSKQ